MATVVKCNRCGRTLTATSSIARGYGRVCHGKIAAAAERIRATYKPAQITKAIETVELAAIVRTDRPNLYLAVSSRGDATYNVDQAAHRCTCPAGERSVACYHLAAADIMTAA